MQTSKTKRSTAAALRALALCGLLAACGGGSRVSVGTPPPPTANQPPVFTSSSTATVPEDTAGAFYTATARDPENSPLVFSIQGGVDRDRFNITTAGALSFVVPPDFEAPIDTNRDNIYLVDLRVSDGQLTATLSLAVSVTDVTSAALRVRRVAANLNQPVFVAPVPDGSGRVFVVELPGRVLILTPSTGAIAAMPFLDVTGQISVDGERGLLGFATAPDFNTTGTFYVFLTAPDGTLEVRRYRTLAADRNRADPATADPILRIPHPRNNHNGGWIGFGPDSLLYIGTGDGGGSGDPDDNGQNPNTLLGKLLRVDPTRDDFPTDAARDYGIPAGNPFASGTGGAREVLAYGLRNPFRNGFDPATGNLLIGDVGQGAVEEIDLFRPGDGGANYGWPILEGTQPFRGGPTAGLTPPVAEYGHGTGTRQGNTVIGGYVYRGPLEVLRGLYFFADFITPNIWSLPATSLVQGTTIPSSQFTVRTPDLAPNAGGYDNIVSFGLDQTGNLYIVDLDGEIFVIEPVPATAAINRKPWLRRAGSR